MEAEKSFVYVMVPGGIKTLLLKKIQLVPTLHKNSTVNDNKIETTDINPTCSKTCNDIKMEKQCAKCKVVRCQTEFNKNQRLCKRCIKIYYEWRKLNSKQIKEVNRDLKQLRDEFFAKHLVEGQVPEDSKSPVE